MESNGVKFRTKGACFPLSEKMEDFFMRKNIGIVLAIIMSIALLCACSNSNNFQKSVINNSTQITETTAALQDDEIDEVTTEKEEVTDAAVKEKEKTTKQNKKETKPSSQKNNKTSKKVKTENKKVTTAKKVGKSKKNEITATTVTVSSTAVTATTVNQDDLTMTIECKSILDNMNDLKLGHEAYVPKNGVMLNDYRVTYQNGMTAYDLLCKAGEDNNITISAENSIYGGMYVSGINNIDELDCGAQSGWTYYVNGKMPNITCSKYKLNKGDKVVFSYTCSYK